MLPMLICIGPSKMNGWMDDAILKSLTFVLYSQHAKEFNISNLQC